MKIAFGLVPQFASTQTYEASVAGCVPPAIGVGGTASQSRALNVSIDGCALELGRRYPIGRLRLPRAENSPKPRNGMPPLIGSSNAMESSTRCARQRPSFG